MEHYLSLVKEFLNNSIMLETWFILAYLTLTFYMGFGLRYVLYERPNVQELNEELVSALLTQIILSTENRKLKCKAPARDPKGRFVKNANCKV